MGVHVSKERGEVKKEREADTPLRTMACIWMVFPSNILSNDKKSRMMNVFTP